MSRSFHRSLRLENLEQRNLLTAGYLENGWIGVLGTKADDTIEVSMSNGYVRVSDNGHVRFFGTRDAIAIRALGGHDTIIINDNVSITVIVEGGKGDDFISLGSGNDVAGGGAGHDHIIGGDGIDLIIGEAGNDIIQGGNGNDVLSGGKGADAIYGGEGDDMIVGDAGHDSIYGEWGDDQIAGMAGNDLVDGGIGDDDLSGEAGNDSIFGGFDNDRIDGGAGKDNCQGDAGDDMVKGGAGVDSLNGGLGFNLLDKDKGKDIISNGLETDLDRELWAGAGDVGLGTFTATVKTTNLNGQLRMELIVRVQGMTPNASLPVLIDGQQHGQISTDNSGSGELVLTAMVFYVYSPPDWYLDAKPGAKIQVGLMLTGEFTPAFLIAREPLLPQMALIPA
jgi:Ca2+-binding RTX toxin-like protein